MGNLYVGLHEFEEMSFTARGTPEQMAKTILRELAREGKA